MHSGLELLFGPASRSSQIRDDVCPRSRALLAAIKSTGKLAQRNVARFAPGRS